MDKEQLIRELKYTKEKHKNDKLYTFDTDISAMCSDVLDVLNRCVEIPDNVTNGDVIHGLYMPYGYVVNDDYDEVVISAEGVDMRFSKIWWNSPYK